MPALAALLRADVEFEMPPIAAWFAGRPAVLGSLSSRVLGGGQWGFSPTRANGQPAYVVHNGERPYGVQVLTLAGAGIARITAFNDPALVPAFTG